MPLATPPSDLINDVVVDAITDDNARDFDIAEMFFSTTDQKGIIRSGNRVFVRVSGHAEESLIGAPHNIIRHPHMPRVFFRELWDHLRRDEPVAGLVKNRAKDGCHYWVVALLTPIPDGYLSVRFKPSSPLFSKVESLYQTLLSVEETGSPGDAVDRAATDLSEHLKALGFSSYTTFMQTLLHEELKSRDRVLAASQRSLFSAAYTLAHSHQAHRQRTTLRQIRAIAERTYQRLNELYTQLDGFAGCQAVLAGALERIAQLAAHFPVVAFNATLSAGRLGVDGRALVVISDYLNHQARDIRDAVGLVSTHANQLSERVRALVFGVASARLQLEMVLVFCDELSARISAEPEDSTSRHQGMITDLERAFGDTMNRNQRVLSLISSEHAFLAEHAESLRRIMLALQVAHASGSVESGRLPEASSMAQIMTDVQSHVDETKSALVNVTDALGAIETFAKAMPAVGDDIAGALVAIENAIQRLRA